MSTLSIDQTLGKARLALNKGRIHEACTFYSGVLEKFSENKRAHDGLVLAHNILAHNHINSLISIYNQDELETVVEKTQQLIKSLTHASLLWNILGVAFRGQKRFEESIQSLRTAISLQYDFAEAYFNMGGAFFDQGDYPGAIEGFQQALKFKPKYFDAVNNLGAAFRGVGDFEGALKSFEQAVKIQPNSANTYFNIGVLLHDQGNNEEAIHAYTKAISLKSDCAAFYNNLGIVLKDTGAKGKALEAYEKAVLINPNYFEAHNNVGVVLNSQGKRKEAIEAFKKALDINPDYDDAYANIGNSLKRTVFSEHSDYLQRITVSLLERKTLVNPKDISDAAISLLKVDPKLQSLFKQHVADESTKSLMMLVEKLSESSLLIKLMGVSPITDIDLEVWLTNIRSNLLSTILNFTATPNMLRFQSALALQCYTNGYIYAQTNIENEMLETLDASVTKMLSKGEQPSPQLILCLASYKSLYRYDWGDSIYLVSSIKEVLERQVLAPREEDMLKPDIPVLEEITDQVSLKVGNQYEEHPYPKWINLGVPLAPCNISEKIRRSRLKLFGLSVTEVRSPRILIAGCGTGKQSITTAATYDNSRVLAVDLSLASLAYAKRKTQELGIQNIEYMQGDILSLSKMNEKFDIIECVGVLHHMEDPMAGWQTLKDCLKLGGLMKIGLYSEYARKHIVQLRKKINHSGVGVTDDDMKSFRHTLIQSTSQADRQILLFDDFYCLDELKDLLFHVNEHRFTLTQIKKCLSELDLDFCGFEANHLLREYKTRNSEADDCYDLEKWQVFEEQNQSLFANMYQFWCQKN